MNSPSCQSRFIFLTWLRIIIRTQQHLILPDSPYTRAISAGVLKLQEQGTLKKLKKKWWVSAYPNLFVFPSFHFISIWPLSFHPLTDSVYIQVGEEARRSLPGCGSRWKCSDGPWQAWWSLHCRRPWHGRSQPFFYHHVSALSYRRWTAKSAF